MGGDATQPTPAIAAGPFDLSVVIPAYNEEKRLPVALEQVTAFVERTGLSLELVVVDDGSRDGTSALAEAFSASGVTVRVLRNEPNRGKGYSVRRGMMVATGPVILMTDSDMSTPMDDAEKLLAAVGDDCPVVIGSRCMPDSDVPPRPTLRRLLGWGFRCARRVLMLRDLRDTQCGFKLFTRDAARDVFPRVRTEGFAFDPEALGIARKLGYGIREVGVRWAEDTASRLSPFRDSLSMLLGLIRLRIRLIGAVPEPEAMPDD